MADKDTVPLIIFNNGERTEIGRARIFEDGKVTVEVADQGIMDSLNTFSWHAYSIGDEAVAIIPNLNLVM